MRLGTTTFSFANEWQAGRCTLEQLLRRAAELGCGPGLDAIGHQVWRGFPRVDRADVTAFRLLVDELELEPCALGGGVDLLRRIDRQLTTDEGAAELIAQIDAATALGFPLLLLHPGVPTAAVERAASHAERAGVVLATEFQAAQTPHDAAVAELLALHDRIDSPVVALALDFSVAMRAVPRAFVDAVLAAGMPPASLEALVALWDAGVPAHELVAATAATDAPPAAKDETIAGFARFGRQEPRDWLPLVPRLAHAHAKFWELDAAGDEPTVRTEELFAVLRDGGFEGFVCSEWGGSAWADLEVDAFDLAARYHARCRDLVASPALEVPA